MTATGNEINVDLKDDARLAFDERLRSGARGAAWPSGPMNVVRCFLVKGLFADRPLRQVVAMRRRSALGIQLRC